MKKISILLIILFSLLALPISAFTKEPHVLKVGVISIPPFAFQSDSVLKGIAVDTWTSIMANTKQPFKFIVLNEDIESGFKQLEAGKLDVLIGPIAVTPERINNVYYSLPYYTAKLSLVSKPKKPKLRESIQTVAHDFAQASILIFIVLFLVYINLFCYLEQKYATDSTSYWQNVNEAIWKVLLQHKTIPSYPKSIFTRIIALVWNLMSMLFFTSVTATVTTAFLMLANKQLNAIHQLSDLNDKKVVVIKGSYDEKKAQDLKLHYITANTVTDALNLVNEDKADAMLSSKALMQHEIQKNNYINLTFSPLVLGTLNYAFAFRSYSPLVKKVNVAIAKLENSSAEKNICLKYLGNAQNVNECT